MKIIHALDSGGLYGKETMVIALANRQVDMGHEVQLVVLGEPDIMYHVPGIHYNPATVTRMVNFLENTDADVVHAHDYKISIPVGFAKLIDQLPPVVRTLHGYTIKDLKMRMYKHADYLAWRMMDKVVACSEPLAKEHNIDYVPNGIPKWSGVPDDVTIKQSIVEFCSTDDFIVGCMARFSKEKNLINLIKAIDRTNNTKLVLFGDGEQREEIEELINDQYLRSRVLLVGFDRDAKYYLPYFDVYIQPSLTEGTPISVLEAMSTQTPMILTRVGGMAPIVDAAAAFECQPTVEGIVTSINNARNGAGCKKFIVEAATEMFDQHYSDTAAANAYQAVYNSVI